MFREGAVRMVRETGQPIAHVADCLGINPGTLGNWVKKDGIERGEAEGLTSDERAALNHLRKENAELRMPRDILKPIRGSLGEGGDLTILAGLIADQRTTSEPAWGMVEALIRGRTGATPQKYPDELRERAVRLVFDMRAKKEVKHGPVTWVADQLGIEAETLRKWVRQAEIDGGERPGTTSSDAERIKDLEREVRELRRANAILRSGFGSLRGGARPPTQLMVDCTDGHREEFGVEPICETLQFAPSTYCHQRSRDNETRERHLGPLVLESGTPDASKN